MSVKPSTESVARAIAMHEGGSTVAEIKAETGLNYSQAWLAWTATLIEADPTLHGGFIKVEGESVTAVAAQIVRARDADQSWGLIAVRCQIPESRVRKIFAEATAIDSKGLRIGKGGRWVADDPRFYSGADRAKLGTELDPALPVHAQVPDGKAAPTRMLPVKAQEFAPKAKVRAPRKPRTPKAKAE